MDKYHEDYSEFQKPLIFDVDSLYKSFQNTKSSFADQPLVYLYSGRLMGPETP